MFKLHLKRLAIVLLIAVFSLAGIIACSNDVTDPSQSVASSGGTETATPEEPIPEPTPDPSIPEPTPTPTPDPTPTPNPTPQPTFDASTYYKIYVPYAGTGDGYYNVSYQDTNTLRQLWFDQINRKGVNDGKVFAIRNRANDKDANNFQKPINGRQDYYYFAANGDIVYKGGDKNTKTGETVMKRFVGAVIVETRRVVRRQAQSDIKADDVIARTGKYTVGAVYRMGMGYRQASEKFAHWTEPTDGTYEFIAARRKIYTYYGSFTQDYYWFIRRYENNNIEVLVLNEDANEGNRGALGIHSYYEYPHEQGTYAAKFLESSIGRESPESLNELLSHTTTFTDASRWWSFLALPGNPETGTTARASSRLPRW